MSFAPACALCEKPLPEVSGPEIMDRQGHVYHFSCWRKLIDITIQEQRQAAGKAARAPRKNPNERDSDLP